ncbi:MAG: electron transport complex subunit RsxC [Pseudomonadales bacterium]|nr:electron transport complex subunit RsxC [Pseudomonadales bacterium]
MRRLWDIHGGIHPPQNKAQSLRHPITRAPLPPELVLPLQQHSGAPAQPLVAVGEQVLKGQMIARASGALSAAVHAPTSGKIVAIEPRPVPHPSGMDGMAIVLRPDGAERWIERRPLADYRTLPRADVLARIRDAGIAGLGGAGFPTALKLSPGPTRQIRTLIVNGAECEPYITADDMLMRERAAEVVAGARIMAWLLEAGEILVAIEDNKPEAIAAMRAAAGPDLEVVPFPTRYPSGGEKQLIQILTGREVPSGKLPADIGICCQNVGTAAEIHRAVERGEPLIARITTVTGAALDEPRNFEVLLGTPLSVLLKAAGFHPERATRIVMGGPMMGFALPHAELPVVKTTNCVLAPSAAELPPPPPAQACIRCAMCAQVCPVSLLPQQLFWYAQAEDHANLEKHHLFDCIECGACSWVCPSSIPLVQYYRASKGAIREAREQQQKAGNARRRFEARQARIEQQEKDKEARRAARQQETRKPAASAAEPVATPVTAAEPMQAPAAAPADAAALAPESLAAARASQVEAAVERVKAKKLAAAGEYRDVVAEAIERARRLALERAAAMPATPATSAEPPSREALERRIATMEQKLARATEKLAAAERAGESETVALLARARTDLQRRLADAQQELEALAAVQE